MHKYYEKKGIRFFYLALDNKKFRLRFFFFKISQFSLKPQSRAPKVFVEDCHYITEAVLLAVEGGQCLGVRTRIRGEEKEIVLY